MPVLYPLIAALVAYLIGSISFAVVVSRAMGLKDPRTYGSHNPGATNVLRSGSKVAAILTLLLDALKGFVPVVLVQVFGDRFGLGEGTSRSSRWRRSWDTCGRSSSGSRAARASRPRPACCSASTHGSAWRRC
jgi:hypothetical protein